MRIFKLIYVLYKIGLLSPLALYRLASAALKCGINIMTLLCFAEGTYSDKIALVDDHETLSYRELREQAERLALVLRERYKLKKGQKAAFMCKNHASLVKAVFAVSRTGADIYLFNAEMSGLQFNKLLERHNFSVLIYDYQLDPLIEQSGYTGHRILSCHESLAAVNNLLDEGVSDETRLQRCSMGKLVLLTGGTTGNFKEAAHKPSLFNFLNPFLTMLTRLRLLDYNTAYIATPIYHGYGVAVLFLFMALGKKSVISYGFNPERACTLIGEHRVEVATVVPLMVQKMLQCNVEDLKSLRCIASGGAKLNPRLAEEAFEKLGNVLYNLYGTSEAGLNMIATPQDLRYSLETIGRKINGVKLKVFDGNNREVEAGRIGRLCIKNKWSMKNNRSPWIETGDLGYCDDKGYFFLCGRADDMIVSGGENVYPIEVEEILIRHPQVEDAAVMGVSDEKFGQRLKAFVVTEKNAGLTGEELLEWLRTRVARYQLPREIEFLDSMPYTPVGKLDKKRLRENPHF